jgi:hypothetical protein
MVGLGCVLSRTSLFLLCVVTISVVNFTSLGRYAVVSFPELVFDPSSSSGIARQSYLAVHLFAEPRAPTQITLSSSLAEAAQKTHKDTDNFRHGRRYPSQQTPVTK